MEFLADVPCHPISVDHLTTFHGLPVHTFPALDDARPLPEDPGSVAWRLSFYDGETDEEYWDRFLATVPPESVRALVFGYPWYGIDDTEDGAITPLVEAAPRLTSLEAVFLGDVVAEESEISWIEHGDLTPLLAAHPRLRELGVRGAQGLVFPAAGHEGLRTLRFETGGLPSSVLRDVLAGDLPSLECLELWLGSQWYEGDVTVTDLQPLLSGGRLPTLRHLGLQNSELQNEIAAAVAQAPVVAQLESLRLSMGVLDETGAEALLGGQPLTHLRYLDLRDNYLPDAMLLRLWESLEPAGVRVDLSPQKKPDRRDPEERYITVAE
jgi:hypothetical protein